MDELDNQIGNDGAEHLSNMLRENHILLSLLISFEFFFFFFLISSLGLYVRFPYGSFCWCYSVV